MRYSPTYVEAHLALADVLRLNGRFDASVQQYDEVLRIAPGSAEARAGREMALKRKSPLQK